MTKTPTITVLRLALPVLLSLALVAGCTSEEPVTIIFTGDTQGRLIPAG
jgi:hypothetical protein